MKKIFLISIISLSLFTSCIDNLLNTDDPADGDLSGIWSVVETSTTYGTQYYDVGITAQGDNIIQLFNFYGLGSWVFVEAHVVDDIIIIEEQIVEGHKFNGEGLIQENSEIINFEFEVEEISVKKAFSSDNVTAVYTRN